MYQAEPSIPVKVPSAIEIAGIVACLAPFAISMSSSKIHTVNGQVTSFSYSDPVAIGGGIVGGVCGLVGLTLLGRTEPAKRVLRIALCALLVAGGVFQTLRGFGVVGVDRPSGARAPLDAPVRVEHVPPQAPSTGDLTKAATEVVALYAANKIDDMMALSKIDKDKSFDEYDLQFIHDTFVESFGAMGVPQDLTVTPGGDEFEVVGKLPFAKATLELKLIVRRTPDGVRWRGLSLNIPEALRRDGAPAEADALARKVVDGVIVDKTFAPALFHPRLIANTPPDIGDKLAAILAKIGTIKSVGEPVVRTCDDTRCVSFPLVGSKLRATFDVDLVYAGYAWRAIRWNLTYE